MWNADDADLQILLEYPISRRGKRIDAVLIARGLVVVLEFKCGYCEYDPAAIAQVEDYCLDLRDFHRQSAGRQLVPVLVATEASSANDPAETDTDWVKPTWLTNRENLPSKLRTLLDRYHVVGRDPVDPDLWDTSDYVPTPTIIQAAKYLYAGHNVAEITRCRAGTENLTRTTDAVITAIEEARCARSKRICFITGVPGSGKTLAGLNIVHNPGLHSGDLGVFLSGNGPLVRVLTEALARDFALREKQKMEHARRKVKTFIQNVHNFISEYYGFESKVPVDRVIVFDEAQRAWNAARSMQKFKRAYSEPEILLDIMDRHSDWSVIVALVGSGQEIHHGEAGLAEWGRALISRFPHWNVSISPELKSGDLSTGKCLFHEAPHGVTISETESLHLSVNLRSFKAEVISEFVDAALGLEPDRAASLSSRLSGFPIVLTRDLQAMRRWLIQRRRGTRRIGLVASSGARRLRAHGLDVQADLPIEDWFLNGPDDVRSSHFLEVPSTEFGIQGLELDWIGLCWGGDLYPKDGRWVFRSFRGNAWQSVRDPEKKQFIVNKYRVLLTRAREGMAIWVPPGDTEDATRPPEVYDRIAGYLAQCGVTHLSEASSSSQRDCVLPIS
jgi:hypothetical protein